MEARSQTNVRDMKPHRLLTHDLLIETLDYWPLFGFFLWKTGRRAGHKVGTGMYDPCIIESPGMYLSCRLYGKHYALHRLAWFHYYGSWPVHEIDHINGVRSDNRIVNLRDVPHRENAWGWSRR